MQKLSIVTMDATGEVVSFDLAKIGTIESEGKRYAYHFIGDFSSTPRRRKRFHVGKKSMFEFIEYDKRHKGDLNRVDSDSFASAYFTPDMPAPAGGHSGWPPGSGPRHGDRLLRPFLKLDNPILDSYGNPVTDKDGEVTEVDIVLNIVRTGTYDYFEMPDFRESDKVVFDLGSYTNQGETFYVACNVRRQ